MQDYNKNHYLNPDTRCTRNVARFYAPLDGFIDAMFRAGLVSEVHLVTDGQIHRFKAEGDKRRNGWYVFFGDGGAFGSWRTGQSKTWFMGDTCQSDKRKIQAMVKAAQNAQREQWERKHQKHTKEMKGE